MEHNRCAQCRKPIMGRQPLVRLARVDMSFHGDCWVILNLNVQREYALRAQDEGLDALLSPYNRSETGSWLPTEYDDGETAEVVEVHEDAPDHIQPEHPTAVAS